MIDSVKKLLNFEQALYDFVKARIEARHSEAEQEEVRISIREDDSDSEKTPRKSYPPRCQSAGSVSRKTND
jgi:hypothetical protein